MIAAINGNGDVQQTLVVVFLRGGADGLSLVAPVEDDGYYNARPRIAIGKKDAVPLDGMFGLHPLLAPLKPAFAEGQLAILHAAGSEDDSHSHFDAQDFMEHGGASTAGGWLGRFLRYRPREGDAEGGGPLTAIALGRKFPECLRGAPSVTVMQSLDDFSLRATSAGLTAELARLYAAQPDALAGAGRDTLRALARIETMRSAVYRPDNGATYGSDSFSAGLRQAAQLIKARVGVEAVSIDLEGWDSHFGQSTVIEPLMRQLAQGLAAFRLDLGAAIAHTTTIVMTEFGRRVQENSSFGTDHGSGGVMFAMGGGIKGGRMLGRWPGIQSERLTGPGDLAVAYNYRDLIAPVVSHMGAGEQLPRIFPDWQLRPLPLYGA